MVDREGHSIFVVVSYMVALCGNKRKCFRTDVFFLVKYYVTLYFLIIVTFTMYRNQ